MILHDKIDILYLFFEYNFDVNKPNDDYITPLMNCVKNIIGFKSLEILTCLLANGADPNIQDNNGYIAMDYIKITSTCKTNIIDILRDYGSIEGSTIHIFYNSDSDSDSDNDSDNESDNDSYFSNDSE